MIISNFKVKNNFNIFYNNIISDIPGIKLLNLNLYLLWSFKKMEIIKNYLENDFDITSTITSLQEEEPNLYVSFVEEYTNKYSSLNLYLYPYSSVKFFNFIFSSIMPSAREKLQSHLCCVLGSKLFLDKYLSTSSINFKACIIAPYEIKDDELVALQEAVFGQVPAQDKIFISVLDEFVNSYQVSLKDLDFCKEYISSLESAVLSLEESLDKQTKEGLTGYLLNWH